MRKKETTKKCFDVEEGFGVREKVRERGCIWVQVKSIRECGINRSS